jgi:hypothetical protein
VSATTLLAKSGSRILPKTAQQGRELRAHAGRRADEMLAAGDPSLHLALQFTLRNLTKLWTTEQNFYPGMSKFGIRIRKGQKVETL